MTQDPSPVPSAVRPPAPGPERTRAVRMMVLGAVLAVLAPLGGFLAGSMIGLGRSLGDFDAMFTALFAGLFVGGIGAIIGGLGLLRYAKRDSRTGS